MLLNQMEFNERYGKIWNQITEKEIELNREHICSCLDLKTQELEGFLLTFCKKCGIIIKMEDA